jgi:hypothetical protein
MCVHTWLMLDEGTAERFFFRCQRCRAVVSLAFMLGVLHANVHAERGPIVGLDQVQQLVDSVLRHAHQGCSVRKHKRRAIAGSKGVR